MQKTTCHESVGFITKLSCSVASSRWQRNLAAIMWKSNFLGSVHDLGGDHRCRLDQSLQGWDGRALHGEMALHALLDEPRWPVPSWTASSMVRTRWPSKASPSERSPGALEGHRPATGTTLMANTSATIYTAFRTPAQRVRHRMERCPRWEWNFRLPSVECARARIRFS